MPIRTGLLIIAFLLVFLNLIIDAVQGDLFGIDYITGYKSGFTPMSYAYENQEPIFQPEGYGIMGNYIDMRTMGYMKRNIKEKGIPRSQIMKDLESVCL